MSKEQPTGVRTVITTVRGPASYISVTSGGSGFRAAIEGVNQIARELSGEFKIAVLNSYNDVPNIGNTSGAGGTIMPGQILPVLVSGSPVISGNVVNIQVFTNMSGIGTSGTAIGAFGEVASGANLSGLVVTVIAQGW